MKTLEQKSKVFFTLIKKFNFGRRFSELFCHVGAEFLSMWFITFDDLVVNRGLMAWIRDILRVWPEKRLAVRVYKFNVSFCLILSHLPRLKYIKFALIYDWYI